MRAASGVSLAVALLAGGGLVAAGPHTGTSAVPVSAGRFDLATAWPKAARAEFPLTLTPKTFLGTRAVIGTQPTRDGAWSRLLLQEDSGAVRELHRLKDDDAPQFDAVTVAGDTLLWVESTSARPEQELWTASRSGGTAHRLVADMGNAIFYGSAYDLVVNGGRVSWTVAPSNGLQRTYVSSVPLTGGAVTTRDLSGNWALSAWPWITDDPSSGGTTKMRNLADNTIKPVPAQPGELATCDPTWCRTTVLSDGDLARIDLMHPDGSARRQIGGPAAQSATNDPSLLGRFVPLSEESQESGMTGDAALLVYDASTGRTVSLSPSAADCDSRNGILWWSTGSFDDVMWHTVDLRTV